jgi:adenosylmethionine-8-amino-7-oxononanoate aminotransferase
MTPTTEYMQMLRAIADKYDVTLIFDETITGFCKTGEMFAAQTYGVTPDVIVCGKGLSNGTMPLSAMIASSRMAAVFQDGTDPDKMFAHGQTFAGQPLGCAVGLAVLNELTSRNLAAKAHTIGDGLRERFGRINDDLGCFKEVRGKGLLLGVELTDGDRTWGELGAELKKTSIDNNLILRADHAGWFSVAPALCAEDADLDELAEKLKQSLQDALDNIARRR